ncbi:HAMP domain-containing sensor histidine kinase [Pseudonocardia eucalypti]|uniref:histidine kinase n=1 Tax=Pseudonocardia eucalypti TaxID=648755 RepID=A0ABP9Q5G9_9PSEU|nr:signal transduction histidine kinase [Pseudonocardia eucalypti]
MRTRIIGLAALVSALAIGLFGLPLALGIAQYAQLDEESKLLRVADATAIAVSGELNDGDVPSDIPEARDNTSLTVYDTHGNRVTGDGPRGDPLVREALSGSPATGTNGTDLVVAVAVTHETDVIGAVRAASPRAVVYRQVAVAWLAIATLALIALAVAYLLARRAARRLASPLEELSGTARRLGEGDFSVRIDPVGIAEIDAVGQALNRTASRLDGMLARERAFSADASHQLRTPLTGLRLRLEAALDRPDQDLAGARDTIGSAINDVDRLEQTITELLALARDTRNTSTSPLDLATVLDELRRGWTDRLAVRGRAFQVRVEPSLPDAMASTSAVRQVLTVLLDNAATHGAGAVTVTVRDAAEALAIDVSDEGAGVTLPESELFTRRSERATGHGIGLALARSLAEAEGGRLTLSRATPPSFTLLVPLRR